MVDLVAGKGASKLQSSVGFATAMRVLLPGAFVNLALHPLVPVDLDLAESGEALWKPLLLLLARVVLGGILMSLASEVLYRVYEGRLFWPRRLFKKRVDHHKSRVETLLRETEKAKTEGDTVRFDELWYKLRRYPTDEKGDPAATHPTLLGNILATYEAYPDSRYGMDSVFYWPRLWLTIDKETRELIDNKWSVADGLLSMSAVGVVGGFLWSILGALSGLVGVACRLWGFTPLTVPLFDHFQACQQLLSIGVGGLLPFGLLLIILGLVFYRLSIPFHEQNGELFKAVFDLFRDKVLLLRQLRPSESKQWDSAWAYLQYLRIRCWQCDEYYPASDEHCPKCNYPTAESLRKLKAAGS